MSNYLEAIEHYTSGLSHLSVGPACGCCGKCNDIFGLHDTTPPDEQPDDSGGFSWHQCDTCGSILGGDRYCAHGIDDETGEVVHLDICGDCVVFIVYGDEPEGGTP